jgi:GPH family glycoside/pentoside/hexuronide:cation symporter
MSVPEFPNANVDENRPNLSIWSKLLYGSGDWGRASYNTLRQIFYAIFLTDVVGLDPRLAAFAALISTIWDAVNDPLVGALSDRIKTRWGRRRPFLLIFSIPFAFAFLLLWWAPPWHSQLLLMLTVTAAFMIADTLQTLVTVPYLALTPELAAGYDERTSLTTFRMFFNLAASLITAVAAPSIIDGALKSGLSQQQGYLIVASIFGGLALIPYLLIFFTIREREVNSDAVEETLSLKRSFEIMWQNRPFRYATGIYVLNWISFDTVSLMLPYFLLYWVGKGDLLAKVNIAGMKISLESAVLGIMLLTATLTLPVWNIVAQRWSKRAAYIAGMSFWVVVQIMLIFIHPGQNALILGLAFLTGLSVSTAHVMPEAIFPDVIDWDELRTNSRREGMYYGAVNFLRKLSSAFASFLALQVLGWFGYQAPPDNAVIFQQSATTLGAIRVLTGPLVALLVCCAIFIAFRYPLTRERQRRIQVLLRRRQRRKEKRMASSPTFIKTSSR